MFALHKLPNVTITSTVRFLASLGMTNQLARAIASEVTNKPIAREFGDLL